VETVQKTLRKPAEQLKGIVGAGKPAARKAFKDIKATETAWNARGTENLIILKSPVNIGTRSSLWQNSKIHYLSSSKISLSIAQLQLVQPNH
jgi:hypothetical protein